MIFNNIGYQAALAGITLSTLGLVSFIAVSILETNPLTYPNTPFETEQQVYSHGEKVVFPVRRCATRNVSFSSTQAFIRVDSTGTSTNRFNIISINAQATEGCVDLISTPKEVPDYLPEGIYQIQLELAIEGKFGKDFVLVLNTVPFKVVGTSTQAKSPVTRYVPLYLPQPAVPAAQSAATPSPQVREEPRIIIRNYSRSESDKEDGNDEEENGSGTDEEEGRDPIRSLLERII